MSRLEKYSPIFSCSCLVGNIKVRFPSIFPDTSANVEPDATHSASSFINSLIEKTKYGLVSSFNTISTKVLAEIEKADVKVTIFDGVIPNPTNEVVEEAAEIARKENIDVFVAVGGGSSIDLTKAVNILMTNPGPIGQYGGIGMVKEPVLPLIAIPTTAGTSSEITNVVALTDTKAVCKYVSGAALKWFIETMAAEERAYAEAHNKNIYTYLNELALESKPGAGGLFFFPYLLGERAPLWNEYARGMFIGMGMDMKRSDLVRSVFEGTAYALRHVMETVKESGAKANVLRICGGGAKSRTWSQIKASMLKMPVYLLDEKSGDVPVGDALIVGHKVGVFPDLTKAAENIIKVDEIIQPVDEWVEVYDKLYPYYVDMYKHLDTDLKKLKNTVDGIY